MLILNPKFWLFKGWTLKNLHFGTFKMLIFQGVTITTSNHHPPWLQSRPRRDSQGWPWNASFNSCIWNNNSYLDITICGDFPQIWWIKSGDAMLWVKCVFCFCFSCLVVKMNTWLLVVYLYVQLRKKHMKSSHPLVVKKKIVRDTGENSETWFNSYVWFVDRQLPYIS